MDIMDIMDIIAITLGRIAADITTIIGTITAIARIIGHRIDITTGIDTADFIRPTIEAAAFSSPAPAAAKSGSGGSHQCAPAVDRRADEVGKALLKAS